ncbi:MAG TPA: exodeoxyribonuclease VII small subunit [Candidatus Dormibacteraeota bacterium]|nr:exodeoxyribonuclease VII small subunit [Candidatus Dormibacteraeota bacterium]
MEPELELPPAPPEGQEGLDYEAALGELDAVLAKLEEGRVPLEEAMALYERGVSLVRRCSLLLDGAERRVTELSMDPDGLLAERPFEVGSAADTTAPGAA